MKDKLNLTLDKEVKKKLIKQAERNSRNNSQHVTELVNAEERREKRK